MIKRTSPGTELKGSQKDLKKFTLNDCDEGKVVSNGALEPRHPEFKSHTMTIFPSLEVEIWTAKVKGQNDR